MVNTRWEVEGYLRSEFVYFLEDSGSFGAVFFT
jgi:hypothetical protein